MTLEAVPSLLSAVAALVLGGLVGARGRRQLPNLTFAAGMLGLAVRELGYLMVLLPGGSSAREVWAQVALGAEVVMMPAWVVFSVTFAAADPISHFRRWRWAVSLAVLASVALLLMAAWEPFVRLPQPDPFQGQVLALAAVGKAGMIFSLLAAVFVLFQLESALRNSTGVARWTIKYFLLGLIGIFGTHIFALSYRLLYGILLVDHFPAQAAISLLCLGLMGFCTVRHRLLEVDIFISRHIVYRSITVGAAGGYLLALGLAGELVRRFNVSLDLFLTALLIFMTAMALVIGLLSESLRWRVRRFVAVNFYRHKYDYRREWVEFTTKVASVESADLIPSRILERVTETMGIRHGAIWLVDEERRWRLAASAGLPPVGRAIVTDPAALLGRTSQNGRPVMLLEGTAFAGNEDEPRWNPDLPLLVPLIAKGEAVGLLALGTPAGGRLTLEDEDLLATAAAQAATVILSARLAEQLARTRELEALHRVSSFALHDLKNLVSTLSLVTQNAADRGHDPTFQRDAFRAIDGSVKQMRELIARLSDLPKTLDLRLEPTDVNDLVRATVAQMKPIANEQIKLVEELGPVPRVLADPEHLRKALYNLMLNALEAITEGGEVRVRTTARNGSVLLEVADTGQGIPEALLNRGLFTPFRSTKRRGLGIGLYQVKTVVEAHGGRISVESQQGRGTTFSVDLPVAPGPGVPRERYQEAHQEA